MKYVVFVCLFVVGVSCNTRPNIVMFITDDQDQVLGGMDPMTNVKQLIAAKGATFEYSYTVSPVCCPSRASMLTGLYPHNNMAINNTRSGGCYGEEWVEKYENNTFATYLKDAGYNTFYAGKYLNRYGEPSGGAKTIPPGWTEWYGLVGNAKFYNYTYSNNGVPTAGGDYYLNDLIRDKSLAFIEKQTEEEPFLMVLGAPAPHDPFTPAPRHAGMFSNHTIMRTPSFNLVTEDKHWMVTLAPTPLPDTLIDFLDSIHSKRMETLLAVDEMVADVVGLLEEQGLLNNTYLIFTSDNGYHMGHFTQVIDKRQLYETDIRVPFVISGPGIEENVVSNAPILNIDLAPTFLSLAGLTPPEEMDGQVIDFTGLEAKERLMLIEYNGEADPATVNEACPWYYDRDNLANCKPQYDCKCTDSRNNTYTCVVHLAEDTNFKFCRFNEPEGFHEVYNLIEDPYELVNIFSSTSDDVIQLYTDKLDELLACQGANCDVTL